MPSLWDYLLSGLARARQRDAQWASLSCVSDSSCNLRTHDVHTPALTVEHHFAFNQGEQRVVFALADATAGVPLVAELADEDVAWLDRFATKLLHAPTLCVGVATVAAGALSFFMGPCRAVGSGAVGSGGQRPRALLRSLRSLQTRLIGLGSFEPHKLPVNPPVGNPFVHAVEV